jgi:ERF superfamily
MKTSEQLDKLIPVFAKGQEALQNLIKDAANPHLKSKFLSLARGGEHIREVFSPLGIAFTQTTRLEGGLLLLDTRVSLGDQWIESEYPVCTFPARPQELGSHMSYARRYSLFSFVGLVGEDEDDAEAVKNTPIAVKKIEPKLKPTEFDAETSAAKRSELLKQLAKITTTAELVDWSNQSFDDRNRMIKDDYNAVKLQFDKIQAELKGNKNG